METIGKFFTFLILMILGTLLTGIVMLKLWVWFIVPTFEVHPLTLIQAIGVSFVIRWFTKKAEYKKESPTFEENLRSSIFSTILACVVLGVGWILHLFM